VAELAKTLEGTEPVETFKPAHSLSGEQTQEAEVEQAEEEAEFVPSPPAKLPIEPEAPAPRPKTRRTQKREARRLAQYADIRRQQFEEFNELLNTLTHVDDLPDENLNQVRDAIFHTDHPFLMTLVGPFSAGKSSVINALLGEAVLKVGPIPTTDHIAILRYGPTLQQTRTGEISTVFYPAPILEGLSLVDTPGLESVFNRHDQMTFQFLHRADIVLLVMIATQVLTASNLEFMRNLREYGKRVIIVVNQVDVLDEADRVSVREFVAEQSRLHLGFEPIIWLVSAKQALKAYEDEVRDELVWDASGFAEIEEYLDLTLDDGERVRQKLETPLIIAQNSTRAALEHVRKAQAALSVHRKTVDNINAQITAAEKDRQTLTVKTLEEIEKEWETAVQGGEAAIDDLFLFARALSKALGGVVEIVGIGAFFRRFRKQTQAQSAFAEHQVRDALQRVPDLVNKIGPQLEGRDLEDLDRLADYTNEQIKNLPPNLQKKIIGKIAPPVSYDRKPLRDIRAELDDYIKEASQFETKRIDRALRSSMMAVGIWELLVIMLALLVGFGGLQGSNSVIIVVIFFLALAILGLTYIPFRGWLLKRDYRGRIYALRDKHQEKLQRAIQQQIDYGTQLRRDTVAPFTRMVETQADLQDRLKSDLEKHDQTITALEHSLSALLKA
jgi:ribosome biogenesis GTPase A